MPLPRRWKSSDAPATLPSGSLSCLPCQADAALIRRNALASGKAPHSHWGRWWCRSAGTGKAVKLWGGPLIPLPPPPAAAARRLPLGCGMGIQRAFWKLMHLLAPGALLSPAPPWRRQLWAAGFPAGGGRRGEGFTCLLCWPRQGVRLPSAGGKGGSILIWCAATDSLGVSLLCSEASTHLVFLHQGVGEWPGPRSVPSVRQAG